MATRDVLLQKVEMCERFHYFPEDGGKQRKTRFDDGQSQEFPDTCRLVGQQSGKHKNVGVS
jgi:hypothetical protein